MAREKPYYRETIEHILSINGGKIADSDAGWRRTLKMGRREFNSIFGYKGDNGHRTVYQIAERLI
jgi:hypothetical protein